MITRERIMEIASYILSKQGKIVENLSEFLELRAVGFRSLDFAELCLRIENEIGKELNFEGQELRSINTFADVCDFIIAAINNNKE